MSSKRKREEDGEVEIKGEHPAGGTETPDKDVAYLVDTGFCDLVFRCQDGIQLYFTRHRMLVASGPTCTFRLALEGELKKPTRELVTYIDLNENGNTVRNYLCWLDTNRNVRKLMLECFTPESILQLGMFGFKHEVALHDDCAATFVLPSKASRKLIQDLVDYTRIAQISLAPYVKSWLSRTVYDGQGEPFPLEFCEACFEAGPDGGDLVTLANIAIDSKVSLPENCLIAGRLGEHAQTGFWWHERDWAEKQKARMYHALQLDYQADDPPRLAWIKALARHALS